MATSLFSEIPQYIYSLASDGIYVNLDESSEIMFSLENLSRSYSARPLAFPTASMWNIPSWSLTVFVNEEPVAVGAPGSYVTVEREWRSGDSITYRLPAGWSLRPYTGQDQIRCARRFALFLGPVLYALLGPGTEAVTELSPDELLAGLEFDVDRSLDAFHSCLPGATFRPYWLIQGEQFNCFPAFKG